MSRFAALAVVLAAPGFILDANADDRAEAQAAAIAPFIDDDVLIVARLNLDKLDVAATAKQLVELVEPEGRQKTQIAAAQLAAKTVVETIKKAGCTQIYAIVNLRNIEYGPFVVASVGEDGDAANVASVLRTLAAGNFGFACEPLNGSVYFGPRRGLERMKTAKARPRPELADAFADAGDRAAQLLVVPSKDHRRVLSEMLPPLPRQSNPSGDRADARGFRWITLGVDSPPNLNLQLQARFDDEESAKAFQSFCVGLLKMLGERPDVRESVPSFDYFADLLGSREPSGNSLAFEMKAKTKGGQEFLAAVGELVRGAKEASNRQQSMNHLKQLGLAMHNFHSAKKRFPAVANYDDTGKALLSWRVHVLPHLGYEDLYKKFRLDEPWDSEHNKKLIAEMPGPYASPGHDAADGKTVYLAPYGKGMAFDGKQGRRLEDFRDGTSQTIVCVEVNPDQAVVWTQPADLEVDLDDPLASVGAAHSKGFHVGLADGSVHYLTKEVDEKMMRALLTRNGDDEPGL